MTWSFVATADTPAELKQLVSSQLFANSTPETPEHQEICNVYGYLKQVIDSYTPVSPLRLQTSGSVACDQQGVHVSVTVNYGHNK